MDVALTIGTAVVSFALSWVLAQIYYKKTNREEERLFNKLEPSIRTAILNSHQEHLTVKDLNDLIERKTIDTDDRSPLPYIACPKCGSTDLNFGSHLDTAHDEMYYAVECPQCGWGDWTQ